MLKKNQSKSHSVTVKRSIYKRIAHTFLAAAFTATGSFASSTPVNAHDVTLQLASLRPSASYMHDPSLVQLEKGLWLNKKDTEFQAIAIIEGKQVIAGTAADLESLEFKLAELTKHKASQIQSQYGVNITQDGQPLCTQEDSVIDTRLPTLAELLSLEFALSHSNPSFLPKKNNSAPLRICFLHQPNCINAIADWLLDAKQKPVIAIEPSDENKVSLESVFLHELSHHSQYRMGLDPSKLGSWKKAKTFGWQFFENPSTGESGWAVISKTNERFKFAPRSNAWVRCNTAGQSLGVDGLRVKHNYEAQQVTSLYVQTHAMVRPATRYFTNPAEVMAEGLMLYRLNEDTRAYLKAVSPELYDLVQTEDQQELDLAYGAGIKVRLSNGTIADELTSVRLSSR